MAPDSPCSSGHPASHSRFTGAESLGSRHKPCCVHHPPLAEVAPYTWNFLLFPSLFFWLIFIHYLRFSSRIPPWSRSSSPSVQGGARCPLHKYSVIPYFPWDHTNHTGSHLQHRSAPSHEEQCHCTPCRWHTVGTY